MTGNFVDICFCQIYKLKSDVEAILNLFNVGKSPQIKKASREYSKQFLSPRVTYQKRVGLVNGRLRVNIVFSPKQYHHRARELLTMTKMTKATNSYLQAKKQRAERFFKKDRQYPTALRFVLHATDESGSGFTADVVPKILNAKIIKSKIDSFLGKVFHTSRYGDVCPDFQYDASDFRFIGGILPTQLPVPKSISDKVGKPSLSNITLGFEGSPIGLNRIELGKNNGKLALKLKMSYRVNRFKDVYPKVLRETKEVAEFFLVRVT